MTDGERPENAVSVLVELRVPPVTAPLALLPLGASLPGFARDEEYAPVPMAQGPDGGGPTVIIRGTVDGPAAIEAISARQEVVRVWTDTPIAPFAP